MVNERSSGVQYSQDDQRVSKRLMDSFDRSGELSVFNPRGGDLGEPEDRQRISTGELQDDTDDRCRGEEYDAPPPAETTPLGGWIEALGKLTHLALYAHLPKLAAQSRAAQLISRRGSVLI
jgi:hypothetical protein